MKHIIAISCQKQQMTAVTEHESNTIAEYSCHGTTEEINKCYSKVNAVIVFE
jgi:cobalamin biosynthesis Co2+ chelatase CbiK